MEGQGVIVNETDSSTPIKSLMDTEGDAESGSKVAVGTVEIIGVDSGEILENTPLKGEVDSLALTLPPIEPETDAELD